MKNLIFISLSLSLALQSVHGQEGQGRLPEGFVYLRDVAPSISQVMSYATSENFTGQVVPGYANPSCILTRQAATALKNVEGYLNQNGYGLVLFDCYRPERSVAFFGRWAAAPPSREDRTFYFPEVDKKDLIKKGYIAARSSHSRGSTVDVGLRDLKADGEVKSKIARCDQSLRQPLIGTQLNMGTTFDCFSHRSATYSSETPIIAQHHRKILLRAMNKYGFSNYAAEWWHFTLQAEPFKSTYFDFVIE